MVSEVKNVNDKVAAETKTPYYYTTLECLINDARRLLMSGKSLFSVCSEFLM